MRGSLLGSFLAWLLPVLLLPLRLAWTILLFLAACLLSLLSFLAVLSISLAVFVFTRHTFPVRRILTHAFSPKDFCPLLTYTTARQLRSTRDLFHISVETA